MSYSITEVFTGYAFLGRAFNSDNSDVQAQAIGFILGGLVEKDLKIAFAHKVLGHLPITDDDLVHPEVVETYNRLLSYFKNQINAYSRALEDRMKAEADLAFSALKAKLAASNKPDPMGTVAELALKFNKSKSEIRRLKAEGLLHTLEETK